METYLFFSCKTSLPWRQWHCCHQPIWKLSIGLFDLIVGCCSLFNRHGLHLTAPELQYMEHFQPTWQFSWVSINAKLLLSYIWALKLYADLQTKIQLYLNILCLILYFIMKWSYMNHYFFILLGGRKDLQISLFFLHGRKLNFFFFLFSRKLKVTQITRDWTIDIRTDPWDSGEASFMFSFLCPCFSEFTPKRNY